MIHCINCIWAFGCLDLDTDDYLNQQVEECKNYIDYREPIKQKNNNETNEFISLTNTRNIPKLG